tara:strand:- start:3720 stop:4163 length:444 start_codon:yes stop_codon:yes gene_type:complete
MNGRFNINNKKAIEQFLAKVINDRLGNNVEIVDLILNDMGDDMQTRSMIYLTNNMSVITGLLRSSITVSKQPLRKEIGTNVSYAKNVEYGTSPHEINASVLIKTPDDSVGKWRYIKQHPGSDPKPYLRPAFNEIINNFDGYVKEYFP